MKRANDSVDSDGSKKQKVEGKADTKEPVFPTERAPSKEELERVSTLWRPYIGNILFGEDTIRSKTLEMAKTISSWYQNGEIVLVIPILKGAFIFASDLTRHLTCAFECDFLNVMSYGAGTESTGTVTLLSPLRTPVKGRHVLIVEDLIDSGLTLEWAQKHIAKDGPASLRIVCLLNKHGRRDPKIALEPDLYGFDCPNKFVVGYGMDFNQQYRCLPYVCILKPEAYKKKA